MNRQRPDIAAIVWLAHEARTAAFASWLGARLYNVQYLKARRPLLAPLRYVLQWFATWWILLRDRPRYVYVTNSPPVAGLCVMTFCLFTRTEFVMDVHPPSLFNRKWGWTRPVQRFTSKFAKVVVTDQDRWAELFRSWGADTLVLTNPPKSIRLEDLTPPTDEDLETFTYVGTFSDDEPVEILLDAARRLPHVRVFLLGEASLAKRAWVEGAPPNVTFTGYIVGDAYWERLYRSAGVVVLTTHAYSLLGGAQDGMRLGRPLILSDQPTLREHFTKGVAFADNTSDGMVRAMEEVLRDGGTLSREITALRDEKEARWREDFARLQALLGGEGRPD